MTLTLLQEVSITKSKQLSSTTMNTEEILSQLNDSQRQAVEYIDGPSLVIAGAGSGKTRVLTYKVADEILKE